MKRKKQLQKAFGMNASKVILLPVKISNIKVARILHCKRECRYCFPHGYETSNSTIKNRQRSWKKFRKTKWKESS
jgi:hypothetical protein